MHDHFPACRLNKWRTEQGQPVSLVHVYPGTAISNVKVISILKLSFIVDFDMILPFLRPQIRKFTPVPLTTCATTRWNFVPGPLISLGGPVYMYP
jgi:hypothetical protein